MSDCLCPLLGCVRCTLGRVPPSHSRTLALCNVALPAPHPRLSRNRTLPRPPSQLLGTGTMLASPWEGWGINPQFFLDRAATLPPPGIPRDTTRFLKHGALWDRAKHPHPRIPRIGTKFPSSWAPWVVPVPLAQIPKNETEHSSPQILEGRDQAPSLQRLLHSKLPETEPRALIQMLLKNRTDPFSYTPGSLRQTPRFPLSISPIQVTQKLRKRRLTQRAAWALSWGWVPDPISLGGLHRHSLPPKSSWPQAPPAPCWVQVLTTSVITPPAWSGAKVGLLNVIRMLYFKTFFCIYQYDDDKVFKFLSIYVVTPFIHFRILAFTFLERSHLFRAYYSLYIVRDSFANTI